MKKYILVGTELFLIITLLVGIKSYISMNKNIENFKNNQKLCIQDQKQEEEKNKLSDLKNLVSINDDFNSCNIKKDNNLWVSDFYIKGSLKECMEKVNYLTAKGFKVKNYKGEYKDEVLELNLIISN